VSEKLKSYASGDGALHLCFTNNNNNATGRNVTIEDAAQYLEHNHNAVNLRSEKWRVVVINTMPVIVANVKRVDDGTLDINDREFRYSIDQTSQFWKNERHCQDHYLTVETDYKGQVVDVVNYSLRAQIRHFLNNEESLAQTPACPV